MAPRANWKGHLKLSLVSCAVALYPATSSNERVRFNYVNKKTGHRVRNQSVDEGTGDVVADEDRVKGYKIESNVYLLFEEEELDRVALESTHTIDIESFVPRDEIDALYLDTPYYLVPDDRIAHEAFAVIREAMKRGGTVALGRVVLYRRERIMMIEPRGKGLLATTLHYATEVRDDATYFDDIPSVDIDAGMLDLATHIVNTKASHFEPEKFEDRYEQALVDVIKAKRAGTTIEHVAPSRPDNVVNLMDALRRSIEAEQSSSADTPARPGKRGRARTTSSEKRPARPPAERSSEPRKPAKRGRLKKVG